ncbi:MAG: SDR family oxidoreductase [Actinomycetota bacterium]|nr:SDR family oxidoreductase [Actinomycetota bacterium]
MTNPLTALTTGRDLRGRVIVVTGASSGIGRATASRLWARGAVVIGAARNRERLASAAEEMPGLQVHVCDVRNSDDRRRLVETVLAEHGRIDGLVNNAGVGWSGLVQDMPLADVERIVETNLIGLIDLTRLVLPGMLERGDGDIVMTASVAAWFSTPPLTVYCASKFGVEGFVTGLRREVWPRGVRVHSVNPGPVSTEWLSRSGGYQPTENDPIAKPGPGIAADHVAAVIEASLSRRWYRTVAVPRGLGVSRLLHLQPFRGAADVVVGLNVGRITSFGRGLTAERTPGPGGGPRRVGGDRPVEELGA